MKEILVFADWYYLPVTHKMGVLRGEYTRGDEIFSFEYADSW